MPHIETVCVKVRLHCGPYDPAQDYIRAFAVMRKMGFELTLRPEEGVSYWKIASTAAIPNIPLQTLHHCGVRDVEVTLSEGE